jgi:hypothetical protein
MELAWAMCIYRFNNEDKTLQNVSMCRVLLLDFPCCRSADRHAQCPARIPALILPEPEADKQQQQQSSSRESNPAYSTETPVLLPLGGAHPHLQPPQVQLYIEVLMEKFEFSCEAGDF